MAFLDSADAVDPWFDAGSTPSAAADTWQSWDEVVAGTPELAEPAPATQPAWAPELTTADPEAWVPQVSEPEAWAPEVWTPEPAATAGTPEPVAFEPVAFEAAPELWAPALAAEAWAPEPVTPEPARPTPANQAWAPEPVAESWSAAPEPVESWTPEPAEPRSSVPVVQAPEPSWAPEPVAESWSAAPEPVESWTPEPAEPWNPVPVAQTQEPSWSPQPGAPSWTPEPAAYPGATEPWTPDQTAENLEPVPAAWTPEPVAYQPVPEPWTPEPAATGWAPESWAPEPESWTPVPQPEPKVASPASEQLTQTLTAAIDILPQRTSIRTALRRGRRRGDPQPSTGRPFNGGFDPIAPAREFALREGFGSLQEPGQVRSDRPAATADAPAAGGPNVGSVPAPSQPWSSTNVPVERRQYPRSGETAPDHGRSALASEALTELSRLSSYSPTSMPAPDRPGLQRRTPSEVPIEEPESVVESSGQRARTAASVRSMLAGFKAGVERGRTSPAANRPALPPPPRNADSEGRDE